MRIVRSALVLAVTALCVACGDDNTSTTLSGPSVIPGAVSVSISGAQPLSVGQSITLRATATMTDGTSRDVTSDAFWKSTNTFVCAVSAGGQLQTANVGVCDISVAYDSRTATVSLSVGGASGSSNAPASISIHGPRTLAPGQKDRFQVVARDADGSTRDASSSATFSSSNTNVATIGNDGSIEARAPGTTTITASVGGTQGSVDVTVSAGTGAGGDGGNGSGNGGGGNSGGGNGGGGSTGGGTSGSGPGSVIGLDVSGNVGGLLSGSSTQLKVIARMADGSTADVTGQVNWGSDSPLIQVTEDGVLTVVGSLAQLLLDPDAIITAAYGGQLATINVRATL